MQGGYAAEMGWVLRVWVVERWLLEWVGVLEAWDDEWSSPRGPQREQGPRVVLHRGSQRLLSFTQ